jgi:DNA-binding beta-propeller fold protein YncE
MRKSKIYILLGFFLVASCASVPKDSPPELYWPTPPERPRIKFIDYIIGKLDVIKEQGTLKRLFFGPEEEVGFRKPSFVAFRDDVMYVTDINKVLKFDFRNHKYMAIGQEYLMNVTGIAVTSDGTIYVADSMLRGIIIIEPGSNEPFIIGRRGEFISPGGIALDEPRNRFLVADAKKHMVFAISLEGDYLFSIGSRGTATGKFNFPYDVAVDKEGYIYVADTGNFRIQIFSPEGKFINTFGSVGMLPGQFSRPKGLALDSEGHIYVVDASFGNIQIFDAEGNVYLVVGKNGVEPGRFILPMGICLDEEDKIYVVDQANKRIQILQYLKYPDEEHLKPKKPGDLIF